MASLLLTCLFSLSKTIRKVLAWVALSKFIWRLIKIWTVQSCNIRSYINSLQVRPHFLVLHSVCFNEELECQHKPWMADGYMAGCFVTRSGPMGRSGIRIALKIITPRFVSFCLCLSISLELFIFEFFRLEQLLSTHICCTRVTNPSTAFHWHPIYVELT